eukprot:TRINITY_DN17459_c4_g1_i1.p1 TRINITY_DN17459_c4_g1~~TRINITY_DN17459_c4_g1_i1.p1  ORF type:complete len:777 (+),score=73.58 TRINITY_DN17459_c4_g1_i1:301-2331(+)
MWHFPSTGVSGMDLFQWDAGNATWRWVATTTNQTVQNEVQKLGVPVTDNSVKRYRLHFPLYNGIQQLFIGTDDGSIIKPADVQYTAPPIVWYGTSITQGGVVSRPGFAFTNNIMRTINREIFNYGFSGNCLMEIDVVQYLVTIKPAPGLFVVDCEWNMSPDQVTNNTVPLVNYIRSNLPDTPILLVEMTTAGDAWISSPSAAYQSAMRSTLKAQYDILKPTTPDLYYVTGDQLYEEAGEYLNPTVGGVHPTDLGQRSMTSFYTNYLPTILKGEGGNMDRKGTFKGPKGRIAAATKEQMESHKATVEAGFRSELRQSEVKGTLGDQVDWYSVEDGIGVMGRAFNATERFYNRLPAAAQGVVRDEVYGLSLMSTGMSVPFITNSSSISINFTLVNPVVPLWHMPDSGVSGGDLYRYDTTSKTYRNVKCVQSWAGPDGEGPTVVVLEPGLPTNESGKYLFYLPLRNEVGSLQIGVDQGSFFRVDPDYDTGSSVVAFGKKPVVWYGTSIDQGGVASRPGNTYTNILSRNLGRMVLNFGFAGNGEMEVSVASFLTEIDAALIVIDCLPNMNPSSITNNTAPLVNYFRQNGHPTTPILLVAGTIYGDYWLDPTPNTAKRQALKTQFDKLSPTDPNLHLFLNEHNELFAGDWFTNPTVGGTHPSDLGHREIAEFYTGYLPQFL